MLHWDEAGAMLGVNPEVVWEFVAEGFLNPDHEAAKPLRLSELKRIQTLLWSADRIAVWDKGSEDER